MSFDSKRFGEKLARYRKLLKLEIKEVSIKTGMEIQRIEDLENGLREPTGDEVLILSDLFKQDYNYFISNEQKSASEQIDILYRRFGNELSKQDRWKIQEFIYLCECEEFVLKGIEFNRTPFTFEPTGKYFKQHGQDAAQNLRKALGIAENRTILDLYFQFRRVGLHIFRRRLDNSNVSGLFINHPYAGRCILVNYDDDVFRQNFTVAHEAAHALFDFRDTVNISFTKEDLSQLKEVRANAFAASFIIPKEVLIKNKNISWTEDIVLQTALKLQINPQVLLISLKEVKVITEETYHSLKKLRIRARMKNDPELVGLTDKVQQANEILLELGLSSFYIRHCYEAYSKGLISASRMAEMLLVAEAEVPRLLQLFNLQLQHEN